MKERPILFSAPMVRALLAGAKTQTRRAVKPQFEHAPVDVIDGVPSWDAPTNYDGEVQMNTSYGKPCPHGVPGDHLWVKEAHYLFGQWFPINAEHTRWSFEPSKNKVLFTAPAQIETVRGGPGGWWKRNSLFMPRWASRITLEVTDVRVERLQDISEEDAIAEGVEPVDTPRGRAWKAYEVYPDGKPHPHAAVPNAYAKTSYRELWNAINGPGSWDANPWVWCVEFKRITP